MKKFVLLIASFWLALLSIQPTYGMTLADSLNQLSSSFTALGAAFTGATKVTPQILSDKDQLDLLIKQYRSNVENNANPPKSAFPNYKTFLGLAKDYLSQNKNDAVVRLWELLLIIFPALESDENKTLAQFAHDENADPEDLVAHLTRFLNDFKSLKNTAEEEGIKEFYQKIVTRFEKFLNRLEAELGQPQEQL